MLLVIPYFMIAKTLRLQDTRIIMILIMVAFNQPFAIWLMRGSRLGALIPIFVIMLFVQKHFVRGLTSGALK